jgi:RNA polymerase sigma-70 factor (ECF subfamily)
LSAGSTQTSDARSGDSDEQEWVRLAQGGDLAAFNAIVERYQRMAFNLALRMMGDRSLAEDVTQEAFFSAYRNVGRFRGGSLKSWLLTIVANGARDQLRSLARRRVTSLEAFTEGGDPAGPWPDRDPLPDEQAERAETADLVHRALAQLPADQRAVISLVDLQQMEYEEAAEITGISLGTVKSRLFRGRRRLRDVLRPMLELSDAEARPNA